MENQNTEFKREFTPDIKKEIAAFANSDGGVIFVGVDDKGNEVGVRDVDDTLLRISNGVRDGILPDVTMFISYEVIGDIIKITVSQGSNKPYYLTDKGLKPSGVYIRQGASSAPASQDKIRLMIKNTDGDKYEAVRSMVSELTFEAMNAEFTRRNIELGGAQMKTLGLLTPDGIYTNLALLLSDQCLHTIKVACFEGLDKGVFRDRREFSGSLLRQLHQSYEYISLFNKLHATFEGLDRIESKDYPDSAVREALLNAIVHREYSFSASTLISIYDDRIEFVSLGGLVPGLSQDDIMLGVSQSRNEKLANVFYRLRHIEAYGMGLKQIMNSYAGFARQPAIKVTDGAFFISLPNRNYESIRENITVSTKEPSLKTPQNPQHKIILDFIQANGSVRRKDIEKLLGVKQTRAFNIISEMLKLKMISAENNGKGKRYVI